MSTLNVLVSKVIAAWASLKGLVQSLFSERSPSVLAGTLHSILKFKLEKLLDDALKKVGEGRIQATDEYIMGVKDTLKGIREYLKEVA